MHKRSGSLSHNQEQSEGSCLCTKLFSKQRRLTFRHKAESRFVMTQKRTEGRHLVTTEAPLCSTHTPRSPHLQAEVSGEFYCPVSAEKPNPRGRASVLTSPWLSPPSWEAAGGLAEPLILPLWAPSPRGTPVPKEEGLTRRWSQWNTWRLRRSGAAMAPWGTLPCSLRACPAFSIQTWREVGLRGTEQWAVQGLF